MARPLELSSGDCAMVDEDDYEWLKDENWTECPGHYVYSHNEDGRIYLHRAVMGEPTGMYVSFIDRNYKNCRKDNLFCYNPNVTGSRLLARKQKLGELWKKGVDVSQYTKAFGGPSVTVVKETGHPETYEIPFQAPKDVRALRTQQGTLVYVDAADYPHLERDDWRDTGRAILRSTPGGPTRLAQVVANSFPDELVGYYNDNYHHCWRDNLFYYQRGRKLAGRLESMTPRNRRLPSWAWEEELDK